MGDAHLCIDDLFTEPQSYLCRELCSATPLPATASAGRSTVPPQTTHVTGPLLTWLRASSMVTSGEYVCVVLVSMLVVVTILGFPYFEI